MAKNLKEEQANFDQLLNDTGFKNIPDLVRNMEKQLHPKVISKPQLYKIRNGHRIIRNTTLSNLSKLLSLKGKPIVEREIQRRLNLKIEGEEHIEYQIPKNVLRYETLNERLERRQVGIDLKLKKSSFLKDLENPLVVDNAILESPFAGFQGVSPDKIIVEIDKNKPILPEYVEKAKESIQEPIYAFGISYLFSIL
jgi:hypothetical protein